MKKKLLIPILSMILLAVAVLGYPAFKKSDIPQNEKQSITASESQKEVTSEESFISYSSGFEITNLRESYVYTGEPIDLAVDIINNGAGFDETFLLYVNGRQNSYKTDINDEKKQYHTIPVPDNQTVSLHIFFEPENCNKGDKVPVTLIRMMNMDYMLPDTSYLSFFPNHEISSINPFYVKIEHECKSADDQGCASVNSWQTEKLSDDFEEEYIVFENGRPTNESYLDDVTHFELYQNDRYDGFFECGGKELNLTLDAYGKSGAYRVGIYIDHILQPAFDGKYYCDVLVDREMMSSQTVSIDVSYLKGLHCIYAIAIPIEEGIFLPIKTSTKLLNCEEISKQPTKPTEDNDIDKGKADELPNDNGFSVTDMIYFSGDKLLVKTGDEWQLYDMQSKSCSEHSIDLHSGETVVPLKSGLAYIPFGSREIMLYDDTLNPTGKITLPEHDELTATVSYDGERIAYSYPDESGKTYLYTNSIKLDDEKLIASFEISDKLDTVQGIRRLCSYKDGIISFSGSVLTSVTPQDYSECMVVIEEKDADISHQTIEKGSYISQSITSQQNFFVVLEDFKMGEPSSGIITYSPFDKLDVKKLSCEVSEESHYAVISEGGKYLATYVEESGTIRVYDLSNDSLIKKAAVTPDLSAFAIDESGRQIIYINNSKLCTLDF